MSEPHRPVLKIHVGGVRHSLPDGNSATTPGSAAATPNRVILKSKRASISTPADIHNVPPTPLTTTKAGRLSKPSAKKREHDEYGDEEIPIQVSEPPSKRKNTKQKLLYTKLKLTSRRIPVRPPGDGYDSEASDREADPAIEEQIVFRMLPGEHLEYLRKAVEENKVCSKKDGGADFKLRWLSEESRRAVITIKGQHFVGVLLDLPTITEGMKSWDRKQFMKSADISQMLLVFKQISTPEEAKTTPLPSVVEPGFKWPHGLNPPMHDCVKRRFAKIISRKEIEDKEAEVERLLAADRASAGTRFEWVDDRRPKTPADYMDEDDEDEDAEGEVDDTFFEQTPSALDQNDEDIAELFDAEFNRDMNAESGTPITAVGSTPAANVQDSIEEEEEEEAESEEDPESDDDDDDDMDEEEQAAKDEKNAILDEVKELKATLKQKEADLQKDSVVRSTILRKRVMADIKSLKDEIRLKMSSIGVEEDENDED